MSESRIVDIFLTGGFDSSFRAVQLSKMPVTIQPYYVYNRFRSSTGIELSAIHKITEALKSKSDTLCTFLPLEIINREKLWDPAVNDSYKRLLETDYLAVQYVWCGSFGKFLQRGIELSIHDPMIDPIKKYGSLKMVDDPVIGKYYKIDTENSSRDIVEIFGYSHFPLYGYTKLAMKQVYEESGCSDIIDMTWFCYNPKTNPPQPCGDCNPCQFTMKEGLFSRFSPTVTWKYRFKKMMRRCKPLYKIYKSMNS
ncbi:MAG: hypothetical protein FWE49_06360 [Synergistaceae bacterium]|nr:hypothetical protein [Synergistaceae bacterium]